MAHGAHEEDVAPFLGNNYKAAHGNSNRVQQARQIYQWLLYNEDDCAGMVPFIQERLYACFSLSSACLDQSCCSSQCISVCLMI